MSEGERAAATGVCVHPRARDMLQPGLLKPARAAPDAGREVDAGEPLSNPFVANPSNPARFAAGSSN